MGIEVHPRNAPPEEDDPGKPIRRQGAGGLLLLDGKMETQRRGSKDPEGTCMTHLTMTVRKRARSLRNAVVLGMLGLLLLAGCHTTAGFGQDMQSVGRNIQNNANKNNR